MSGKSKGRDASRSAARGRAGYVVKKKSCNRCGHDGSEHRLEIHHKDRDVYNNDPENLEVLCDPCHTEEHRGEKHPRKSLRWQKLALELSGNSSFRKCPFCHVYDDPANMMAQGRGFVHRACRQEWWQAYRQRRWPEGRKRSLR